MTYFGKSTKGMKLVEKVPFRRPREREWIAELPPLWRSIRPRVSEMRKKYDDYKKRPIRFTPPVQIESYTLDVYKYRDQLDPRLRVRKRMTKLFEAPVIRSGVRMVALYMKIKLGVPAPEIFEAFEKLSRDLVGQL